MTRSISALATAAALLALPLPAAAQPAGSAAPAARAWQVDWGQYYCSAIRGSEPGRRFFTAFVSIPGGTGMSIRLVADGEGGLPERVDNVVLLPGGTAMPVERDRATALPGQPLRLRNLSGLPADFRTRLASASEMQLRSGDRIVARVPLDGIRGALNAQRECISDVAREWGVDEPALASLSRLPDSTNLLGLLPSDYPAEAIRQNAQGRVAVRIAVAPDGRASDCVVVATSGNGDLDATTCRVALSRGRFMPGLDAGGRPVATRSIFLAGFSLPEG